MTAVTATSPSTTAPAWQPRSRTNAAEWGKVRVTFLEHDATGDHLVDLALSRPYNGTVPYEIWRGDHLVVDGKLAPTAKPADYGDLVTIPQGAADGAALGAWLNAADAALNATKPYRVGEHAAGIDVLKYGGTPLSFARHDPRDDTFRNEYFLGDLGTAPQPLVTLAQGLRELAEAHGLPHRNIGQ